MKNRFAVIGLGRFGMTIAKTLAEQGAEVLAIDADEDRIESISDEVAYAIAFDATDKKKLEAQNIHEVDGAVVAIGENFEAVLLCAVNLQELKVKRLIVRSASSQQSLILKKLGIKEVLSPEDEVGIAVAQKLLNPDIITALSLPDQYEIAEVHAPEGIWNTNIAEIKLREKYSLNLITIKRSFKEMEKEGEIVENDHTIGVPTGDTTIFKNDVLLIMGKASDIERFLEVNH